MPAEPSTGAGISIAGYTRVNDGNILLSANRIDSLTVNDSAEVKYQ